MLETECGSISEELKESIRNYITHEHHRQCLEHNKDVESFEGDLIGVQWWDYETLKDIGKNLNSEVWSIIEGLMEMEYVPIETVKNSEPPY